MRLLLVVPADRWSVVATCRERGDCELLEFLNGLPANLRKSRHQLLKLLQWVSQQGPPQSDALSHRVSDENGIWEFIKGDLRVLYFCDDRRLVVCLCGFVKHGRKTPRAQVAKAARSKADYLAAKAAGAIRIEEEE